MDPLTIGKCLDWKVLRQKRSYIMVKISEKFLRFFVVFISKFQDFEKRPVYFTR